jgi:hypothetical protein
MKINFTLLFILLLSALSTFGQDQDKPMPDRWRGLVIDQSTPDDAIKILGKPAKDKLGAMSAMGVDHWLTKRHKEKIFRNMEFGKLEGMKAVYLSFLDDKLVSITVRLDKSISPEALTNIYGVKFEPQIGAMDVGFSPRDYERNQGKIYPKTYPTVYQMVAVSENSFVDAMVENVPSFGGALARSAGVPDTPGSFPGKVHFIQLVSRTLENRDGADVLK